jgi:mannose-6-phosphate isomerase-like protein (cupin superfamily)
VHKNGKSKTDERKLPKLRIIRKEEIDNPFRAPLGELIYEMIGSPDEIGGTSKHSLAHVVIPPGLSSPAHYHDLSEETYYILEGEARMIIDGYEFTLSPGQACLIMPREVHQIFNDKDEDLEFLTVSAPAWTSDDYFEA